MVGIDFSLEERLAQVPIGKHLHQIKCFKDPSRFRFVLAGRRGGKTTLLREEICRAISQCPPKGEIFYIGPTNAHAMELMFETAEDRFEELGWKFKPRVSKQRFEFSQGRKLYIIGAEKIRRIRGHPVFMAVFDEIAFFDADLKKVWRAVRPSLTDLKGRAVAATTPNGKGTQAYDFFLNVQKSPAWTTHVWRTLDNPAIDPEEIEAAKHELDEKSFKQEYEVTWESFEGLAYYNFDENLHIKKQPEISDDLPVILGFDFNVNPTTLLVAQNQESKIRFKKEYSLKNSSTEKTVMNFCEDFKHKADKWRVKIRGDAAGRARSSQTGFSNYDTVEELLRSYGFKVEWEIMASNPSIVDRVQQANSFLKNVYGEPRIEIDPSCSELIKDLSSQQLEGRFPSDKGNVGHKADAFGYIVHVEWLNSTSKRTTQRQL